MAQIISINGVKHVPAHAYEPGAVEHDGDHWRPIVEPCRWCGSTEGTEPGFDGNERCKECQGC